MMLSSPQEWIRLPIVWQRMIADSRQLCQGRFRKKPKSVGSGSNQSLSEVAASKVCQEWQHPKVCQEWQHPKSKIGASDQERLRWPDQASVDVTRGNYKMMALQTIEAASWPDQVPVEGIDAQVPICGRYSRGTKILQQPGEAASVSSIALMLWRA
jgi:hypothetical protein